ncbi:hypothetical protein C943_02788 [Mariniradius saccharolyticus AK6]|uniref:Uncharacterized protein n=1 Tax=Mariniradius saccharolyticus AK6 TaxID=1239962 RepID=M7Y133_9BACT|nr:hypothetical protein C943_02788 [Mariniradius saccharolyticus AK6]
MAASEIPSFPNSFERLWESKLKSLLMSSSFSMLSVQEFNNNNRKT